MLYLNIDIDKEENTVPFESRRLVTEVHGIAIPCYSYNMVDMPKVQEKLQQNEFTLCTLNNAIEHEYYNTAREYFITQIETLAVNDKEKTQLLYECVQTFKATSGGSGDITKDFAVFRAAQINSAEIAYMLGTGLISGIYDVYCLSADKSALYLLDDGKDFDLCTFRTQYDIKEYSKQNIDVTACMFSELQYKYQELKKFNTFKELANEVPLMCLRDYIQEMLWGLSARMTAIQH